MENFTMKRYQEGMVLSAVGDALGFKNGEWEFERNGEQIHECLKNMRGLGNLTVSPPDWKVSDDTIMHLATAEALVSHDNSDGKNILNTIAKKYKSCMKQLTYSRAPGLTCIESIERLKPSDRMGFQIPFNNNGGGCGAAMRSMCIGLRFPRPEEINDLLAVSIESGRMTHHHPTGYLGSLASALFTSYAVQQKPLKEWGRGLLKTVDNAKQYIKKTKYCWNDNKANWRYFKGKWKSYLGLRGIYDKDTEPFFMPGDNAESRDYVYKWISYEDCGGSSGHDAPMIAYDAMLACEGDWTELCNRAMFHGGDSDSTGVIAGCLYGIFYGTNKVPKTNFEYVEYIKELNKVGEQLFNLANKRIVKDEYYQGILGLFCSSSESSSSESSSSEIEEIEMKSFAANLP